MFFVFIGGQSASGKTGVSQHLEKKLTAEGMSTQILKMDDYFYECPAQLTDFEKWRAETNFDLPEMLNLNLFKKDILALYSGKSIVKQLFDFKTNTYKGTEEVHPSDVIIIEGIFGQYFYDQYLASDFPALSVNVATEAYNSILNRRILRDTAPAPEGRGRKKEDVISQERKNVGPGFFKYTAKHAGHSDVYVSNLSKNTPEEQSNVLEQAAIEIKDQVKKKIANLTAQRVEFRIHPKSVREMVEESHVTFRKEHPNHPFFDEKNDARIYHGFFGATVKEHPMEHFNPLSLNV
jgi:uridine kinase